MTSAPRSERPGRSMGAIVWLLAFLCGAPLLVALVVAGLKVFSK